MKLFHLLGFTKKLVFDSSTSVTRLNLFPVFVIDRWFSLLKHLVEVAFY